MSTRPASKGVRPGVKRGSDKEVSDKRIGITLLALDGLILAVAIFLFITAPSSCPEDLVSDVEYADDYNISEVGEIEVEDYDHKTPVFNKFQPSSYGSSSYSSSYGPSYGSPYGPGQSSVTATDWSYWSSVYGGLNYSSSTYNSQDGYGYDPSIYGSQYGSSTYDSTYGSQYGSTYGYDPSTYESHYGSSTYGSTYGYNPSTYGSQYGSSTYGSTYGYGYDPPTYGSQYGSSTYGSTYGYDPSTYESHYGSSAYGSTYGYDPSTYGSQYGSSTYGSTNGYDPSTYGSQYGSSTYGSTYGYDPLTYGSQYGSSTYGSTYGYGYDSSTYGSSTYGSTYGYDPSTYDSHYGSSIYGSTYGYDPSTYNSQYGSSTYGSTYGYGYDPSAYGTQYGSGSGSSTYGSTYGYGYDPSTYGSQYGPSSYGSTYGYGYDPSTYGSTYGYDPSTYGSQYGPSTYGSQYGPSTYSSTYGYGYEPSTYGSQYSSGSSSPGHGTGSDAASYSSQYGYGSVSSTYGTEFGPTSYGSQYVPGSGSSTYVSQPGAGSTYGTGSSGYDLASSGTSPTSEISGASIWGVVPVTGGIEKEVETLSPGFPWPYPYKDLVNLVQQDHITNTNFKCGVSKVKPNLRPARVVGGSVAVKHSWPWTVSLAISVYNGGQEDSYMHACGGTIVSPKHVISALHCFEPIPDSDPIAVKTEYRTQKRLFIGKHDDKVTLGDEYKISMVRPHPKGVLNPTPKYDLVLMTTVEEIKFNDRVQPVCLPKFEADVAPKTLCWSYGWGTTKGIGPDQGPLKQVQLDIGSIEECHKHHPYEKAALVKGMTVCAGTRAGHDTCQGDSGGPLTCQENGQTVLHGATSWGMDCGKGLLAAYADVAYSLEWFCCYMAEIPGCEGVSCNPEGVSN